MHLPILFIRTRHFTPLLARHFVRTGCWRSFTLERNQEKRFISFQRPFASLKTLTTFAMSSRNVSHTSTNRLADEKSPYLLQHKDNPVDWYPWGSAAFNRAKDLNKPIFLSIGYSTCHWCHVMERESFENADIAKLMNDNFVCVKVDREERPDVDRIYMTFIQATQGGGGWPLSVFLTPDLKPITGGTYFPPVDRYNRPGFGTILMRIADAWKKRQPEVEAQSTMLLKALRDGTIAGAVDAHASIPDRKVYQKCFKSLAKSFDKIHGGFGSAPKFPQPVNLNVLFRASVLHDTDREMSELSLSMCYKTLDGMAHGGIYDHIGYGFHRYSTDAVWHVPHFEKMLYDNAQLLGSYVEGFQISKNSSYEITARRIVEYISRDLTDGSGGIYSAEDADSYPPDSSGHKKEGAFYVWSELEIDTALPQLIDGSNSVRFSDVFKHHFGVKKGGNVDPYQDPHEELTNQNVLIINGSIEETAKHFSKSVDLITDVLEKSRSILFDIRAKRPRPHLDDKMITAWNGLVLSGLAKAAQALQDDHIKSKAISVATFAQRYLFNEVKGVLLHSVYKGKGNTDPVQIAQPIEGFCEDYACLIRGLLDLYETCFDPEYLKWAYQLQTKQDQLFWDADNGGYFSSHSQDASLLLRLKEETDGAEPSPNSVSLSNLLRLALIFDNENWTKKSISMFKLFSDRLQKIPVAVPEMVSALMFHHEHPRQVIIFGEHTDPSVVALIAAAQQDFVPFKCILLMDKRNIDVLRPLMGNPEVFAAAASSDGVSAHICRNFTCGLPIKDPKELRRQLA